MAFNPSAPFGQSSQPAFGQPSQQPQQPNTANPFAAPASSGSPPGGKITFGTRAAAGQQPAAAKTPPAQFPTLFGSAAEKGQNNPNSGIGTGGLFGSGGSSPSAQGTALGTTPQFGGNAPGSGFSGAGFGAFGQGKQTGQGFNGFGAPAAAAVSSSAAAPSPPNASGFSGPGFGAFGQSKQTSQGFNGFGAPTAAATTSSAAPAQPSNAFARLGARVSPAPAADKQNHSNDSGASPFARLGQTAPTAASTPGTQPSTQAGPLFGNQQAGNAVGFGPGPAVGSNAFGALASGAAIQPGDFGRAAKRTHFQQQQQQQQQTAPERHQAQADKQTRSEQQHPKRHKTPALLPKQLSNHLAGSGFQPANTSSQAPAPGNDLADPAAMAARSQRFGPARPQSGGGSSWRSSAAAGLTDTDADTTDDQQGSDREEQVPQGRFNSFNAPAVAPTSAQPATPVFMDAGPSQEEGQPNVSVEGFCKGMCPDYQLRLRVQNVTEKSLEAVDPKGRGRGIEQLATKKWERNVNMTDNAALPTMFRTLSALKDTEQHLLDYLDSDDPRLGLGRVSMYMWDRQRSIRQDIAWQKMEGPEVMRMYEEHAMSAIYMDAEMSHHGDPGNPDSTESYHPGLVVEQLNKTLISMTAMYELALQQGRPGQNAAEFNTYAFIMLLVGTRQKDGPTAFFQRHILPYSPSPYVALALRLHRLVVSEVNPWAFFKLMDKASYRLGLWLQFLFPRMRYLYLTRIVSASGPRANPETRPVAELAHAMWFDSQEDTLEFLLKAGLEPEQSNTGTWQLVLHRSLKVDSQAASFRQRSGRLCSQQAAPRSQNVRDQGQADAVRELVSGSTAMLQPRQPPASLHQQLSNQQQVPNQAQSSSAFSWSNAQPPTQPALLPGSTGGPLPFGAPSGLPPSQLLQAPSQDPAESLRAQQAQQQQERQRQEQAERHRLEQERLQRQQQLQQQQQQQQEAQAHRQAEEKAKAERAHQQQQAEARRREQQRHQQEQAEKQRRIQQEQQHQQELQQQQQQQQLQRHRQQEEMQHQEARRAQEQDRLQHEQRLRHQQHLERKADGFARAQSHRKVLQRWRQLTADCKAHYGQQAILAKLAASLQKLRPGPPSPSQVATRRVLSTAERPLPGHPQSQQGALQEALPLPALVAPTLAAANQDHAYLRWKAVIHSMPSTTAAAAHGPDFHAARWFHKQMSHRDGSAAVPSNQDGSLSVAFTDLRGSQPARAQPLSGIFTAVCDASSLTAEQQASRSSHSQALQDTMAGSSALVLLLTRADNPGRTEASLRALLGAAPAALKIPLVLLTTAPDLHQGVQQWLKSLPGKLGRLWQHVTHVQTFCLAQRKQQKTRDHKPRAMYSRAALRDALKWAAVHAPAQLSLKSLPLEQLLAKQLEPQLEALRAAHHAAPSAWIATFNHMLLTTWHQITGAADLAKGVGGWPAPEIAKMDATLPEQWWQPQAQACLEGALSSLCLPGMSASLGASPHQAVPIYVQHYLGISTTSPASWQQTLAAAMHSRVQAVQQQNLAHVVIPAHPVPPALLARVTTPCRLSHASGLPLPSYLNGVADKSSDARRQQHTSVEPSLLVGPCQPEPPMPVLRSSDHQAVLSGQGPQVPNGVGPTAASYAAAVRASHPEESSQGRVSYADVVMQPSAPKFAKRKVPEGTVQQELQMPIKRHQNGFDASLSGLQEQSSKLQRLLEQSKQWL